MGRLTEKDRLHHDVAGEDIVASSGDGRFSEYRRRWDENPINQDPGDFPLHLDIEVTSYCNLKCPFCATTYSGSNFKNGFITFRNVKKILDEAGEYNAYACKFNMRGEPLLHRELGSFIRYAKKRGLIDVFFNTNAVLLDGEKAKMLVDSGLDRLTVSLEGFEKTMYEKNRVGAQFETVVANIERLRKLRDSSGSSRPKIRIQAVLIPELRDRMDEFIAFWKDRVDQVSYNDMLDNIPNNIKPVKSSWICPFLYQRMMIMWDGTITTCYNDFFGKSSVGNIESRTIRECWVSAFDTLRKLHREGRSHEIEACSECPLRMNELTKKGISRI